VSRAGCKNRVLGEQGAWGDVLETIGRGNGPLAELGGYSGGREGWQPQTSGDALGPGPASLKPNGPCFGRFRRRPPGAALVGSRAWVSGGGRVADASLQMGRLVEAALPAPGWPPDRGGITWRVVARPTMPGTSGRARADRHAGMADFGPEGSEDDGSREPASRKPLWT